MRPAPPHRGTEERAGQPGAPTLKDRFSIMVSLRQLLVLICSLERSASLNQ